MFQMFFVHDKLKLKQIKNVIALTKTDKTFFRLSSFVFRRTKKRNKDE